MTTFAARTRKTFTVLVSATALLGSLAASAEAKPWPKPFPGPFGYGPAAFVGGLALGAIAAGTASAAANDCMIVRRVVVDDEGNEYVRRIRVCD